MPPRREYHPSGALAYEGDKRGDTRHGQGGEYDEHGQIMYLGGFREGEWHGEGKEFNEAGNVIHEGLYAHGNRHGHGIDYDGTGCAFLRVRSAMVSVMGTARDLTKMEKYAMGITVKEYVLDMGASTTLMVLMYDGTYVDDLRHGYGHEYEDGMLVYAGAYVGDFWEGMGTEFKEKLYFLRGNVR